MTTFSIDREELLELYNAFRRIDENIQRAYPVSQGETQTFHRPLRELPSDAKVEEILRALHVAYEVVGLHSLYVGFDLAATRRENGYLRKLLEQGNPPAG